MQVDGLTNDEVKSHLQVGFISPFLPSVCLCGKAFKVANKKSWRNAINK